jgi:hypothetical protein
MINQKVLDMKCKSYSMHSFESEGDECIFLEQYKDISVNMKCESYCADFQKFMFVQQRFVKKTPVPNLIKIRHTV